MPNYNDARQYADVVRTFAVAETNEVDTVHGIFNMPLSFLTAHSHRFGLFPVLPSYTQQQAEIAAMATYLHENQWFQQSSERQDLFVQAYHLGIDGVFSKGYRQPDYVEEWHKAAGKVHGSVDME